MPIDDPIFYLAAIPAVILVGLAKGGFAGVGVLAMPLLALVMSPIRAASIMLPLLIVQDAISVWFYRHTFDRRNLAIMIPGACVGIALGYVFAAHVSDAAIEFAVGVIAVVFAARHLLHARKAEAPPSQGHPVLGVFWGGVAGFVSMIANAGAPPFQVYVLPQRLPRDVFVGTGVFFFAAVNWIKIPPFLALGLFTRENLATSMVLLPLAALATWLGVWLVRRVSVERFYKIIYATMAGVGLKLICDGTIGLMAA
ncbi:MAG: sulfite exporter TauE/SafE family protein [Rhodospirillaceae bacterium]|nr:sulfite exporter TauE/SafE family protein [Rhodospirillaceae bacterium]